MSDKGATLGRREVRRNVVHAGKQAARNRASRSHHFRAVLSQYLDDGAAHSLRPSRDERSATRESEIEAHVVISSLAIEVPSRVKRYCRSTGLPGKSPVTRANTVTSGLETSTASGSLV